MFLKDYCFNLRMKSIIQNISIFDAVNKEDQKELYRLSQLENEGGHYTSIIFDIIANLIGSNKSALPAKMGYTRQAFNIDFKEGLHQQKISRIIGFLKLDNRIFEEEYWTK